MKWNFETYRQRRAEVFDWFTFFLSLSLSLVFPSLRDMADPAIYSPYIFGCMVLYTTGALLKDFSLRDRLHRTHQAPRAVSYLIFMLVGHWMIFLFAIVFSDATIRSLLGYPAHADRVLTESGGLYMIIPALITWLVFKSKSRPVKWFRFSPGVMNRVEGVADLLLFFGVGGLSFLFWERGILGIVSASQLPGVGIVLFWMVLLGICFVLFYLPLRYLFMVDDYQPGATVRRLLIIFGVLFLRFLVEGLGRL